MLQICYQINDVYKSWNAKIKCIVHDKQSQVRSFPCPIDPTDIYTTEKMMIQRITAHNEIAAVFLGINQRDGGKEVTM